MSYTLPVSVYSPVYTTFDLYTYTLQNHIILVYRILKLMKDSTSSFDFEEFIREKKRRCTHQTGTPQTGLDKGITMGKVEASVKVVNRPIYITKA